MTTAGLESEGEVMAGVIAPVPVNPSLGERVRGFLIAQVAEQTLRWRLWAPVAFGGGCAVYFSLKSEPTAWPLVAGWMHGAPLLGNLQGLFLLLVTLAAALGGAGKWAVGRD